MTSVHDEPYHEPEPFEPTEDERAMAAQILGDGDPDDFLDLHPVETADEVERFVGWVESERMCQAPDAYIQAQAEEMAAGREAEEMWDEGRSREEAQAGPR